MFFIRFPEQITTEWVIFACWELSNEGFSWNMKRGFRWVPSTIRWLTSFKRYSWRRWNPSTAWMPLFSKSLSISVFVTFGKSSRLASLDQQQKVLEGQADPNQLLLDNLNNKHYLVFRALLRLLEQGLKERMYLICPLPESDQRRNTVSFWFLANSVTIDSTKRAVTCSERRA